MAALQDQVHIYLAQSGRPTGRKSKKKKLGMIRNLVAAIKNFIKHDGI